MSDAQYEVIKETFPKWAERVEMIASTPLDEPTMAKLFGMADGIRFTGLCGDADAFVMKAIERAKKEAEHETDGE